MPAVNVVEAAQTRFIARFDRGLRSPPMLVTELAMEIPSTGQANEYQWRPYGCSVREWKGSRHYQDSVKYEYTLKNRKWEQTETVPVDAYEDDQGAGLALYDDHFEQMGMAAAYHPQLLLAEVMVNGFTENGIDGTTFFSTAHLTADGANNRSNRVASDAVLAAASFESALTLIWKMKAYNGDPLNLVPRGKLVLVVPPALRSTAEGIVSVERLASGASNPNYKRAELMVMPELETHSSTAWFLCLMGPGLPKPFILQKRKSPELIQKTSAAESDHVFDNDEIVYGSKARYNVGYNHPEVIIGSQGDAS